MLKIHSEPSKPSLSYQGPAIFALGFRPFFSVAGLAAVVLLGVWLVAWSGKLSLPTYYGLIGWHSHEMLFGYTTAIIAGFLLTAVRNWTGITPPIGRPLAGLVLLWLAGRIAPLLQGILPDAVIAITDLLFLPAVALAIRPALWQGKQKINRIFVPLLLVMAVANLLVHLQALGLSDSAAGGSDMMLYLVIFLIMMIGGRVVPFFTQASFLAQSNNPTAARDHRHHQPWRFGFDSAALPGALAYCPTGGYLRWDTAGSAYRLAPSPGLAYTDPVGTLQRLLLDHHRPGTDDSSLSWHGSGKHRQTCSNGGGRRCTYTRDDYPRLSGPHRPPHSAGKTDGDRLYSPQFGGTLPRIWSAATTPPLHPLARCFGGTLGTLFCDFLSHLSTDIVATENGWYAGITGNYSAGFGVGVDCPHGCG